MSDYRLGRWRPTGLSDLIRLGRDFDGGYVVSAASIDAATVLVGMGINDDWSFESDFAARLPRARIVGIDGSVSTERFRTLSRDAAIDAGRAALRLDRARGRHGLREARRWYRTARGFRAFFSEPGHHFIPRYLGHRDLDWAGLVRSHLDDDSAIFVKMDIEGAEYEVLPDIVSDHARITGCAIEFHDCGARWSEFVSAMDALSEHFVVAHLHGNNWAPLVPGTALPSVMEVSLVHRRLVPHALVPTRREQLPVPGLDMPNCPARPEYILPL